MKNIKNIILDLGGVLFDLSYEKTTEEFAKLGLSNAFSKANQIDIFDEIEEGKITPADFFDGINTLCGMSHNHEVLLEAWNIMLLGMPKKRLDLLVTLKSKYRLFLYSNTNQIHIKKVFEILKEQHGINNLNDYFEVVYLSNELGIRKPKAEGFKQIVKTHQLNEDETLFIDDSPQHVEGALKAKINAEWLDLSKEDIHSMLERFEII
jgi:HAD superfamily hydrolase (TIGR01549 family)